jgi:hypothetical protein
MITVSTESGCARTSALITVTAPKHKPMLLVICATMILVFVQGFFSEKSRDLFSGFVQAVDLKHVK